MAVELKKKKVFLSQTLCVASHVEHARKAEILNEAVIRNTPVRGEYQEFNDDGGDYFVHKENGAASEVAEYEYWDYLTAEDCENRAGIIISEPLASSNDVQSTAIQIPPKHRRTFARHCRPFEGYN